MGKSKQQLKADKAAKKAAMKAKKQQQKGGAK